MHGHHEWDEGMDPEEYSKQARGDGAQEFEVQRPDQRTGISSRSERAENADLFTELRPLPLCESDECFCRPLRMADEAKLLKAGLGEDPGHECGEIHHAHLTDVPCPHAGVCILQKLVFWFDTAPIVSKPDVVATSV